MKLLDFLYVTDNSEWIHIINKESQLLYNGTVINCVRNKPELSDCVVKSLYTHTEIIDSSVTESLIKVQIDYKNERN